MLLCFLEFGRYAGGGFRPFRDPRSAPRTERPFKVDYSMIRVSRLLSVRALAHKPGVLLVSLVLVAGVFSSACDSSTAPSLVAQNLVLAVASTQLPSQGGTVSIVANVTNGSGKPMPGVAVTFTATGGTFAPATPVTTDAAGQASVQLTTTAGTTFKASAMGLESAAQSVSVKGQATVTITAVDGTDLPNGVSLPFDFKATRSGAAVSGTLVVAWGDGTANAGTAFTGSVRLEHKFEKGGTYSITATLTESDTSRASAATSVKIREGLDQIDISKAIMVSPMDDPGVTKWPIDSELTQIYVDGGQTCLDHTMNGKWPYTIFEPPDGGPVEGTHIIFANIGGQIYGGVYRLLPARPDVQGHEQVAVRRGADPRRPDGLVGAGDG